MFVCVCMFCVCCLLLLLTDVQKHISLPPPRFRSLCRLYNWTSFPPPDAVAHGPLARTGTPWGSPIQLFSHWPTP